MSERGVIRRHFTATGFVVQGNRTLLHWHKRLQQWMPPGGHIEPDEDPVQAVLREIREETGAVAEVIPSAAALPFTNPDQLQPPYTILVEDIPEPGEPHQHIDFIYFCRLAGSANATPDPAAGAQAGPDGPPSAQTGGRLPGGRRLPDFHWVDEAALRSGAPLDLTPPQGAAVAVAEDVRLLAIKAIETARRRP